MTFLKLYEIGNLGCIMEKTTPFKKPGYPQHLTSSSKVPENWKAAFNHAIKFFPELQDTTILVKATRQILPCRANLTWKSFFKNPEKRTFVITISTRTIEDLTPILFDNVSFNAKVGMIANALAHIDQYQQYSPMQLIKNHLSYPFPAFRERCEKAADKKVVYQGLGWELYDWSCVLKQAENENKPLQYLNQFHLEPESIIQYMQNLSKREEAGPFITIHLNQN